MRTSTDLKEDTGYESDTGYKNQRFVWSGLKEEK